MIRRKPIKKLIRRKPKPIDKYRNQIIHADCYDLLKLLPDNSIDTILSDPPYGLGSQPDMAEVLKHWLNGDDYIHHGKGFMNCKWDSFVPGPSIWKECLRVLKPGGTALIFGGTRTFDMLTTALRLAGFEIRNTICWLYGTGMPKAINVSKAIDKQLGKEREIVGYDESRARPNRSKTGYDDGEGYDRSDNGATITAPASPEALKWNGWYSDIKPAHERIVVAQKPLTYFEYCIELIQNLSEQIELCKQNVKNAEKNLELFHAELNVGIDFVQSNVEIQPKHIQEKKVGIGKTEDQDSKMDILQSIYLTENIALNTLSLWKNILVDHLNKAKMSTTLMEYGMTIDWKILNFCLLQITQKDITPDESLQNGLNVNASNAAKYFNAVLENLKNTQTLSVLENAIVKDRENSLLVVDEKVKENSIVVAQKPLDGTFAENALKWGVSGLWIDGSRIQLKATGEDSRLGGNGTWKTGKMAKNVYEGGYAGTDVGSSTLGRFPANVILSHTPECELIGSKKIKNKSGGIKGTEPSHTGGEGSTCYGEFKRVPFTKYGDENGMEEIEEWKCADNCPVKILDEQSKILKNTGQQGRFPSNVILNHTPECELIGIKEIKSDAHWTNKREVGTHGIYGKFKAGEDKGNVSKEIVEEWKCADNCPVKILDEQTGELGNNFRKSKANGKTSIFGSGEYSPTDSISDTGGASRFFYCAKASKKERGEGCEEYVLKNNIPIDIIKKIQEILNEQS